MYIYAKKDDTKYMDDVLYKKICNIFRLLRTVKILTRLQNQPKIL